jgi:hypothetical protein
MLDTDRQGTYRCTRMYLCRLILSAPLPTRSGHSERGGTFEKRKPKYHQGPSPLRPHNSRSASATDHPSAHLRVRKLSELFEINFRVNRVQRKRLLASSSSPHDHNRNFTRSRAWVPRNENALGTFGLSCRGVAGRQNHPIGVEFERSDLRYRQVAIIDFTRSVGRNQ